jgi:hypothetical protein
MTRPGAEDPATRRRELISDADHDIPVPDQLYQQLWSCVPVRCVFGSDESRDGREKECEFIVPRQSFLYYYTEVIQEAFSEFVRKDESIWYSYRSALWRNEYLPLPIQFPVSVLCDLVAAEGPKGLDPKFQFIPPLQIRVHFSAPVQPDKSTTTISWADYQERYRAVIKLENSKVGYLVHRQMLKQALSVRYGSTEPLSAMESLLPASGMELFSSVKNNDQVSFWKARCVLQRCGDIVGEEATFYAVYVHTPAKLSTGQCSRLIRYRGSNQKLGMFLKESVPQFADKQRDWCHSSALANVLIQGVRPMLSTPMESLLEVFGSVDMCLHIVIIDDADL